MNVLGINGSPRIGGNTDILLDTALEAARGKRAQTEKVILNSLVFSPCQECEKVRDDGVCIINDDMQSLYLKIKNSDVIILASPIFFGSLSAQMKMMVDRFQCVWRARYILGKKIFSKRRRGAFISVEASHNKDFFNNARSIVKNLFAVINADYQEELLCPGVDEKTSILRHTDFLMKASELGQKIVSVHKEGDGL